VGLLDRAGELKTDADETDEEILPDVDIAVLSPEDLVEENSPLESDSGDIESGNNLNDLSEDNIFSELPGIEDFDHDDSGHSDDLKDMSEVPGIGDEPFPDMGVIPVDTDTMDSGDIKNNLTAGTNEFHVPEAETGETASAVEIDMEDKLPEIDDLPNEQSVPEDMVVPMESMDNDIDLALDLEEETKSHSIIDRHELDDVFDLDTVDDSTVHADDVRPGKTSVLKTDDAINENKFSTDEKPTPGIKEVLSDMSLPHDEGELSSVLWDSSAELIRAKSQQDLFNTLLLLVMGQTGANAVTALTPVKGEDNKWGIYDTRGARLRSKMITFRGSDPIMNSALTGKRFVDIEEFAGMPECRDEYPLFNSISGRYILPMIVNEQAIAVLAIGDKISGEEYLPQEKAFLLKIVETAGNLLSYIITIESLNEENQSFIARNKEYSDIEKLEHDFRKSFVAESAAIAIADKMNFYGAESFAFFSRSERGDKFLVRFTEKEDLCSFRESDFSVPVDSEFCSHLVQHDEWEEFEHPASSRVLRSVFSDSQILRMNICVVYPFVLRGYCAGFLVIMRAKRERLDDCRVHAMRLARTVFSIVQQRESILIEEGSFIDTVVRVNERMERTVREAEALKIPVSFVLFSVKNIKRYIALFGGEDAEQLMESFRSVLESRISGSEYSLRMERGRIMAILPGKSRKYAMPFATAVRNELVSLFSEREAQILLSFLIAEYPADGKGLCEILEYLD